VRDGGGRNGRTGVAAEVEVEVRSGRSDEDVKEGGREDVLTVIGV